MKIKAVILAASMVIGSFGAVAAQQAPAPLPAAVTAAIAEATATCKASPADCKAAMAAVVAVMKDAGLSADALDDALVSLATALTTLSATLTPAQQAEIAGALEVVADNVSEGNPFLATLTEIVAALESGQASSVVAQVASPN